MGTPLTGSTVASTYTGLLKTSDNATITSTLKSLGDGGGNDSALQVSNAAVNTTGDFTVNTSRFSVLSASGNTSIAGTLAVAGASTLTGASTLQSTLAVTGATTLSNTLAVTGATTLSSTLAVSSNISTSGGNLSVYGNIVQSNAAATNTLAGSLSVGTSTTLSSLTCNGLATFNGGVSIPGAVTFGSTLNVTGAVVFGSTLTTTGTIFTSGNLTASGNLLVNGNTTIGNASTDLLTVNANVVTFPNITNQAVDADTDKVIILDSTGRLRSSDANQFAITPANAPQCNQFADTAISVKTATTSGSGADVISVTITPRGYGSMMLISAVINYSFASGVSKGCVFRLTRNGTEIGTSTYVSGLLGIASASYTDSNTEAINNVKIDFFDSPNTASPVTYKIHLYGSGSMYLNQNFFGSSPQSTTSTITVQEYFA